MSAMRTILRLTVRRAVLALALFSIACSDAPTAPTPNRGASITIAPPPAEVYVADDLSLTAVVRDAAGQVVSDAPVQWSVDDPSVAELEGASIILLKPGAVRITARSGAVASTRDIIVRALTVDSVVVATAPMRLAEGEVRPIGIRVVGPGDRTVTGRPIRVTIEDSTVATIDAAGRLHAVRGGVTNIVATVDGKVGRGRVQVLTVAGRFDLARWNGAQLPSLYMLDTLYVNGVPEYHELYLERGALVMTSDRDALYIVTAIITDYVITYVNGQKLMIVRHVDTAYDRGQFTRQADGSLRFVSEIYWPLEHTARPETNGWMRVNLRRPGEPLTLNLQYRPSVD